MSDSTTTPDTLAAALERHGLSLGEGEITQLDAYCRLLWEWNEKINLTRHTDYERFVARDVVDALQLSQYLESGERVLDVGTGGGMPGVILAILRPDLAVSLCESVAKKARAVADIVRRLEVDVPCHHARAEDLLLHSHFDTLVIRAVAPLAKLMTWFKPHREAFDQMLVVKGPNWPAERAEARTKNLHQVFNLRCLATYRTPGTEIESAILRVWPSEV